MATEVKKLQKNFTVVDIETGELVVDKVWFGGKSCGSGWVMMFQAKAAELLSQCKSPATIRIFLWLAARQTFDGGCKTTKANIQRELNISEKTCIDSFNWLKDNYIVHEWRVDGVCDFMLNPLYISVGKFDDRMKLWNQRWESYMPLYKNRAYQKKKSLDFEKESDAK